MFKKVVDFIKSLYPNENPVPLHAPRFLGNEKKYLDICIDTTSVSYVGEYVTRFEEHIRQFTGAKYAIAMVNGTAALHLALKVAGVQPGDEVITQALTFVATANSIMHCGAKPIFVDVDKKSLGMSSESLELFLKCETIHKRNGVYNKTTGNKIAACVPMHTFGHPTDIKSILYICNRYEIPVIEDAAEALGSWYSGKHAGTFGLLGIFSFNGNKLVTTGAGGMVVTNDQTLAEKMRHISTTGKRNHRWHFFHDEIGYNFRLPNVNAAIGCAQMEKLDFILNNKRELALSYSEFFNKMHLNFFTERDNCKSNYWLNAIILKDSYERNSFLEFSNNVGIQTRPIWILMNKLPMYQGCQHTDLQISQWLEDRVVNIPSSIRI